jgi:hypothetical protein
MLASALQVHDTTAKSLLKLHQQSMTLSQVRTDNVVEGILLCTEHDALRCCNTKKR